MSEGLLVRVEGRVQGVCFRHYTCEKAHRLGIIGWVRNCPDGCVEALICGNQIDQMIAWLRHGPPSAEVTGITTSRIEIDLEPAAFEIRY